MLFDLLSENRSCRDMSRCHLEELGYEFGESGLPPDSTRLGIGDSILCLTI
jgi:hypothetical protein